MNLGTKHITCTYVHEQQTHTYTHIHTHAQTHTHTHTHTCTYICPHTMAQSNSKAAIEKDYHTLTYSRYTDYQTWRYEPYNFEQIIFQQKNFPPLRKVKSRMRTRRRRRRRRRRKSRMRRRRRGSEESSNAQIEIKKTATVRNIREIKLKRTK